jgi:ABC-type multidrug transport system fused ATPase/permease subunit
VHSPRLLRTDSDAGSTLSFKPFSPAELRRLSATGAAAAAFDALDSGDSTPAVGGRGHAEQLELVFERIEYSIVRKRAVLHADGSVEPVGSRLRILDGVSGIAAPGALLAIMGPSGSGKVHCTALSTAGEAAALAAVRGAAAAAAQCQTVHMLSFMR